MANEKNLTHKLTADELRKGGKNSGKTRREQKTVRKILDDIMKSEIQSYPQAAKLAKELGIERNKSIKDLFTVVAMLNTLKTAKLCDLECLGNLLGEDKENANKTIFEKLDEVIGEVNKIAE